MDLKVKASSRRAVAIGSMSVGAGRPVVIAGPCSVEAGYPEQALLLRESGVDGLRACVYKPRTRPESFQGLGAEALPLLAEARRLTGLPLISEVLSEADAQSLAGHVDAFQVGARNMQNIRLLQALGEIGTPVILKRGLSATIDEWLGAADYIRAGGNDQVVLCERGIRTFETRTRNTLDLSSVVVSRELTELPIIVDPSHAAGRREWVPALARAALAAGADGLLVEAHPTPESAWSDAEQAIDLTACAELVLAAGSWGLQGRTPEFESITDGRDLIDRLDAEIGRLMKARVDASRMVQALRIEGGGGRLDGVREAEVRQRYASALGSAGGELAQEVLRLCRG